MGRVIFNIKKNGDFNPVWSMYVGNLCFSNKLFSKVSWSDSELQSGLWSVFSPVDELVFSFLKPWRDVSSSEVVMLATGILFWTPFLMFILVNFFKVC